MENRDFKLRKVALREGKNVISTVPESPHCSVRIGPCVKSLKM
jgi:hypothetical protein